MKKRIHNDMVFFISLIAFVIFSPGHSLAGKNRSTQLSPEGKTISVVVVDPVDNKTLYAGTPSGLLKSTDKGINWLQINDGLSNKNITSLVINPVNTNILYCGTQGGAYKSTEGGRQWTAMNNVIPETGIPAMAIDPSNSDTIYVIARDAALIMAIFKNQNNESIIKAMTRDCVFVSRNKGEKWTAINDFSDFESMNLKIESISIHPVVRSKLFTGTSIGLYRSIDGGASWPPMHRRLNDRHIKKVVIDPSKRGTLYVSTAEEVFKSVDGGNSWYNINKGLPEAEIFTLIIDPVDGRRLYAGTCAGAFRSTDGGNSWAASGLNERHVKALVIDPYDRETLYAGTMDGVFKSTDGGSNWSKNK